MSEHEQVLGCSTSDIWGEGASIIFELRKFLYGRSTANE